VFIEAEGIVPGKLARGRSYVEPEWQEVETPEF
jgi:hypothetical protein